MDFNRDGTLEPDELLHGFCLVSNSSQKEKVETAFAIIDKDGSGYLDLEELALYFRGIFRAKLGLKPSEGKTQEEYENELD